MKKKSCLIIFVLLCALFSACRKSEEEAMLEHALELAGPNRSELQKVLDHYAGDSLKLEAAKFLIRNMPGHYSYVDTAKINKYALALVAVVDSLKGERDKKIIRDSIDKVAKKMGMDSLKIMQDCQIISADFLIQDIDTAFYDWQNGPWAKHVLFDEFCEWILPYKAEELQPLDNWRSRLKDFCTQDLDELSCCDQLRNSPLAAAKILNKNLSDSLRPAMADPISYAHIPTEARAKLPFGRCSDYSSMTTTILRSHGIPVVWQFTPQWARRSMGHTWNVLLSEDGRNIPFDGISGQIGDRNGEVIMPKIFRHTYSRNKELVEMNNSGEFIPSLFRNIFLRDVTKGIIKCSDITLKTGDTKNKYAYLHVFDNQDWVPVAYGTIKKGVATFKDVGVNVIYLPVIYIDSKIRPITEPFILSHSGKIIKLVPDTRKRKDMKLDRKYPVKQYFYQFIPRLNDGEFQASNDADFKTYHVVYHIKEGKPSGQYVSVSDTVPPCRYWRYTSENKKSYCNIAEIMFFAKGEKEKLQGTVIGTEGSWRDNPNRTKETVFDGDVLTSFDAPEGKGCWVGLDMGEPKKVDHIIYYGRGDGNGIEIGDEYELLYWDKGWKSLGRQKAKTVYVKYKNVPQGALYHLRNHTKGTDERIFTFENGKQVWW